MPKTDSSGKIDLALEIKSKIRGKVTLVGIGNPLRGDDGFGPALIQELRGKVTWPLFDCETAPENYITPILNTNPDTIVFLDAADLGKTPGQIGVYSISEVSGIGFSTHTASLKLVSELFIASNSNLNILIIAIQYRDSSFGSNLSEEVKIGIERLKAVFFTFTG